MHQLSKQFENDISVVLNKYCSVLFLSYFNIITTCMLTIKYLKKNISETRLYDYIRHIDNKSPVN